METLKAVLPRRTVDSAPFWDACNEHRFLLRHCNDCHQPFYFPRLACPRCGSRNLDWREASGRGTVHSFTHVAVSFYGADWESQLPYTPIIVDLDEGPRMLSRLIGADRDAVRIGDRVELTFVDADGQRLPYFHRIGKEPPK